MNIIIVVLTYKKSSYRLTSIKSRSVTYLVTSCFRGVPSTRSRVAASCSGFSLEFALLLEVKWLRVVAVSVWNLLYSSKSSGSES